MRERLARSIRPHRRRSPTGCIEAHERNYWTAGRGDARCAARRGRGTGRPPRRRRPGGRSMNMSRSQQAADGAGSVQVQLDPNLKIGNAQGVRRLRQGRHRQEHDVVQPVRRVLQARQAGAADRLRSETRFDLHADQAAGADRDRRPGVGEFPQPRSCASRTSSTRLQRRDVRRGRRTAGRHRLRRLCRRPDREAAERAPSARRHRRRDLRRAGRRGVRRLRVAAAACRRAR